eukprot:EG_transcript_6403
MRCFDYLIPIIFVLLLLFCPISDGTAESIECGKYYDFGSRGPRILLYTAMGNYSAVYWEMLKIMIQTSSFHLGPHIDIAIIAHHSWTPFRHHINASHFIALDDEAFFDMRQEWAGVPRPALPSQSAANKLRIFQLMPDLHTYDMIVMLDADIVVQANFLLLIGRICRNVLYAASHRVWPEGKRSVTWYQSRDFTAAELARVRAKNLTLINTGQFVFRPSVRMEELFRKAYESYKVNSHMSLYEQGHMNTVFLLEGRIQYTLTHLTLLGYSAAAWTPAPAGYALIHVCDYSKPASWKLVAMRLHLAGAFRSQEAVQQDIVRRLWRCLDTSQDCGVTDEHSPHFEMVRSHSKPSRGNKKKAAPAFIFKVVNGGDGSPQHTLQDTAPSGDVSISDTPALTAAYSRFVSQSNVTHMCQVGYRRGHAAAVALFANPSARLTVFHHDNATEVSVDSSLKNLRGLFPNRIISLAGHFEDSLQTYTRLVSRGVHPRCSVVLLAQSVLGKVSWLELPGIQSVVAPPGLVFAAGAAPFPPAGWSAAVAEGVIRETACETVPAGRREGRWCVGKFASQN